MVPPIWGSGGSSQAFSKKIMNQPIKIIFAAFAALIFLSCGGENNFRNLESFYFPIQKLGDGLVYEYRNPQHDSVAPFYHYFRNVKKGDSIFLVGMQYNYLFEPQQLTVEEKISNGMLLTESILYQNDSTGKQVAMPMEIEVGSVFPFKIKDENGVFVYNVKWHEATDSSKFTRLIRNRSYVSDTSFVFEGRGHPAVKFLVREKVESFDEGFVEHEFNTHEIYAESLGLVYYRKEVTPQLVIEYQLTDTYPMSDLEAKFGKQLSQ